MSQTDGELDYRHCYRMIIYVVSLSTHSAMYPVTHCILRPPTTNTLHAMTASQQVDHPLVIGYGNSLIGYEAV